MNIRIVSDIVDVLIYIRIVSFIVDALIIYIRTVSDIVDALINSLPVNIFNTMLF